MRVAPRLPLLSKSVGPRLGGPKKRRQKPLWSYPQQRSNPFSPTRKKAPRLSISGSLSLLGRTRSFTSLVSNLRHRWPTVAPPMRDSFGEVARLDSQPPRPPRDSALMRVAAYGFVFFIYENPFPGSRYMHFDPHNSI